MKSRFYHLLLAAPVLFIWVSAWCYLAVEWSENDQYRFGFALPPLAIYLACRNWPGRLSHGTKSWFIFYLLAWPLLVLAELLRLSDPLWRLTGALWLAGATLLTVGYFAQLGGWPLVRRMIFPIGFLWVGLPWPVPLENQIIQALTRIVAATTTTLMNFAGIAAVQRGNTVELTNHVVGIGTACTGIESFQASLMVSLFLSGLMRLRWGASFALVIAGFLCSLVVNLGRIVLITWSVHSVGYENHTLHDWIGGIATLLIFALILFAAVGLRTNQAVRPVRQTPQRNWAPSETEFAWYRSAFLGLAFLGIPWLANLSLGSGGQTASIAQPRWQIVTDSLPAAWSSQGWDPTSEEKNALRFSSWNGRHIITSDGLWANIVHLFWGINHAMPSTAFYHTPALCMPSAGWQEIRGPEPVELVAFGNSVPFVSYLVGRDLDRVCVLQYLRRGQDEEPFLPVSSQNRLDRLKEVWGSKSESVSEEILIYLPDLGSDTSNTKFANEIILQLLKPVSATR